jgi:ABC-type Fe3+ transport system permease subunit
MNIYLHLPILIIVVSLVYSATRHDNWNKIVREALHWGLRMTTFLLAIGVILFALSTWL